MPESERLLTVHISGQAVRDGRVSAHLLARTISSLQKIVYQVGRAKLESIGRLPRNKISTVVERECELFFLGTKPGSLAVALALPEKDPSLFPDMPDLGIEVLGAVRKIVEGVVNEDPGKTTEAVPEPNTRRRIVRSLVSMLPKAGDDYEMSLGLGYPPMLLKAVRPPDESLALHFGVETETEEAVKPSEAVIDARCVARIRDDSVKVTKVVEYEVIPQADLRPYRTAIVEWNDRRFELTHEIACALVKDGPFMVLEYEPLGIRVFAYDRKEAIANFMEEFTVLWDEIALADDSDLTLDAVDLKRMLRSLVREVCHIEATESTRD